MARLSTIYSLDMAGGDSDGTLVPGDTYIYDDGTLVVSDGWGATVYRGRFTHSDDDWTGTVTSMSYIIDGVEIFALTGISVPTRYFYAGEELPDAFRRALSGDDRLYGSFEPDRLIGYGGDDRISGKGGNDALQGGAGNDILFGGNGNDRVSGNDGRDHLEGGNGNDKLFGGLGPDAFVFDGADGTDRIADFRNRLDKIEITDGARRFAQLDIDRVGDDVRIAFADTVVILEDTPLRHIGAEDFVF